MASPALLCKNPVPSFKILFLPLPLDCLETVNEVKARIEGFAGEVMENDVLELRESLKRIYLFGRPPMSGRKTRRV
jgi:hypothetical protein